MQVDEIPLSPLGPTDVLVRHNAIGINFIDTYHRTGLYEVPCLPSGLGVEAAGLVEELGAEVSGLTVGDRVAYMLPLGCYAEARVVPAWRLVPLPAEISFETAAGAMIKGLTGQMLLRRTYEVSAGETILVHAAAGGCGSVLCQWATALGANVIGTVGNDEKAELARAAGCAETIVYTREDFVARVTEITGGKGVSVVYDSVGKSTFDGSLQCLQRFGLLVTFGQASGAVPPVDVLSFSAAGSVYVTRPTLFHHADDPDVLHEMSSELFEVMASGDVTVNVNQRYDFADAAQAHRDLEARKTTGSSVLIV